MKKRILYFLTLSCFCFVIQAQKVYDFDVTCQSAYKEITALKLKSGQQFIQQAKEQNPNNLIPYFLEDYHSFFSLFFNENPAEYKQYKANINTRLDKLSEGPSTSPFYNFSLAMVYLHKAAIAIKFGEKWSAALDFKKAFGLIKENRKTHPSFIPNNMLYGSLQVAVSTIPKSYHWLTNLFGIRGSIKDGMKMLSSFLSSKDVYAQLLFNEAAFFYTYITFYIENKPEEAFKYINNKKLDLVNNHLFAYMAANLAINNKQAEYAKNIIIKRNTSSEYIQTPIWDFELGYAKLYHLEINEAAPHFENFTKNFKGNFYVKDAYNKLSWCYYLQGNTTAAESARKNILNKGTAETDADKNAQKEARSGTWPNVLLLKTRLLNDGGYHKEALGLLHGKSSSDFTKPEEKLEFTYRVARIYDDLGKDEDAIKTYNNAIQLGINRQEYYASRAALQIGYIYENQGKSTLAISYYQKCLAMENHEYKNSIDQRAKAGIARCKGE